MQPFKPVFLLTFANDRERYLRNLPAEQRRLREALQPGETAKRWETEFRLPATLSDLVDVFTRSDRRNRIAIFHFAGHAGDYELLLEAEDGGGAVADAGGLALFLAQQRGLHLVFLNGCSTEGHVQGLLDAGIPVVIATSRAIEDAAAAEFAAQFYRGLAGGATLRVAFAQAAATLQMARGSDTRGVYVASRRQDVGSDRWPWELRYAPGAGAKADWSLHEATGDHLFGLPPVPSGDLPERPYLYLHGFARDHAEVFFGRGREIRDLYTRVTSPGSPPILLVYGQTGVGKSSLLAAGLLPRLEATHQTRYVRRDPQDLLIGTLAAALGAAAEPTALREAWLRVETAAGTPLIVVLDQAEELFRRSPAEQAAELQAFLGTARAIFGDRLSRPGGKLVISFRKEWLAEIEGHLRHYSLPHSKVFVPRLDRAGVIEAIIGPARVERLHQYYGLTIEERLPELIADTMVDDRDSPIAPTLQILLAKMWDEATKKAGSRPHFDRDSYLLLRDQGALLKDFLDQQIAKVRSAHPEEVDSGLLLDLLTFHTTDLGTGNEQTLASILEQYNHVRETIPVLLRSCQDLYLLVDAPHEVESREVNTSIRLAHDTLAPLIRQRFETSNHVGQRALRILENRVQEWSGATEGAVLDDSDLSVVERGASGMRAWTPDEVRLVSASREARSRRRRKSHLLRLLTAIGLAVTLGAIAMVLYSNVKARKEAESRELADQALRALATHQARALSLAIAAAKRAPTREAEEALRSVLQTPRLVSETLLKPHDGEALSPDGERLFLGPQQSTGPIEFGRTAAVKGTTYNQSDTARVIDVRTGRTISAFRLAPLEADTMPTAINELPPEGFRGSTVQFSLDGERLLLTRWDGAAEVRDVQSGAVLLQLAPNSSFEDRTAVLSPDGIRLVSSNAPEVRGARIYRFGSSVDSVDLIGYARSLEDAAFSPDGLRLATSDAAETVLWDTRTGQRLAALQQNRSERHLVYFSPDGTRILATDGPSAGLWDSSGHRVAAVSKLGSAAVSTAEFSDDSELLGLGFDDGALMLWGGKSGGASKWLPSHRGTVLALSFSPDKHWLTTGSEDATLRIWRIHEWRSSPTEVQPPAIVRLPAEVDHVTFTPDGREVVALTLDGALRRWRPAAVGDGVLLLDSEPMGSPRFSPDGSVIVTTASTRVVQVWDTRTGRRTAALQPPPERAVTVGILRPQVSFHSNLKRLFVGYHTGEVVSWDYESGKRLELGKHSRKVTSVEYSPDEDWILTSSLDSTVRIWSPAGEELALFRDALPVRDAAFTRDLRSVLIQDDKNVLRWDVSECLRSLSCAKSSSPFDGVEGFTGLLLRPPYTRYSSHILGRPLQHGGQSSGKGTQDTPIELWDVRGPQVLTLQDSTTRLRQANVSLTGNWFAAQSGDTIVRLWKLGTGNDVAVIRPETGVVRTQLGPTGRLLATLSGDSLVRLWDTRSAREISQLWTPWCATPKELAFSPDESELLVVCDHDEMLGKIHFLHLEDLVALAEERLPDQVRPQQRRDLDH